MRILYLCQLFEVGTDAGSERHFYFCRYAVREGHRVTAITSNVDYKNARIRIEEGRGTRRRSIEGVDVRYVYSFARFRGSFVKRGFYFATYFFSALIESFKVGAPDVVYAVSTPLSVGLAGYIIARLRRVPFVFEVTDVWPDAAVACGVVKNRVLITAAHWLEMFCYRQAAHIVGLTRGICENIIGKGVAAGKVTLITNGVDSSLFSDSGDGLLRSEVRRRCGFGERLVAMYLGAHGAYNALDTILGAAARLKDDPRVLFVLVGDGDEKPRLQRRVAEYGLSNVVFLQPVPRIESAAMLAAADVFVLPNRKGEFFKYNLPNKVFDFLASARPVVVSGGGETAELVIAAGCGRIGMAEDSLGMATALIELAEMPVAERMKMGAKGREYVLAHYERQALSARFLEALARSVSGEKE